MFDDSDLPYDKIGTTHRRSMSNSVHSDAMVWVLDESYINMNLTGSLNQHTVIERFIHKYASSVLHKLVIPAVFKKFEIFH